ncbi:MAG: recombinase family protein [Parasphingorhabdus sp.]|uniref:recombinase family protein n=1 Tax=Parasphingorhabdus sp. TaxID=2709688 RepID=UPI0032983593
MTLRTVIYARFSSTLQNSRSIEDQIAICRERCDREGWEVVEVFTDYAISGAAGIDENARPGLNSLLQRVEAGGVDQVLAEATDRIARHQGDAFSIREQLEFHNTRLFTLSDGEVNDITGMFLGWKDAKFRKDLGAKIKRGQRGTVKQGRSPAGLAYGYRKANKLDENGELIRGLREIDQDKADIVRRIFREYASGVSARAICNGLNKDGVPGPRGGVWRQSTINGDRKRKNGMLQNQLYIGKLVHQRTSKRTDPRTRRTLIQPNAEDTWITNDVPELRIIDDDLWKRVQERRASYKGQKAELCRRPKRLLSGLANCGVCGGGWIVISGKRWGCGISREGGKEACSNNRTITNDLFEARVLSGLKEHMLDPELVEIYVREYHLDYARRTKEIARESAKLKRQHEKAALKVERLVEAIADGAEDFVEIKDVLSKARGERDALAMELKNMESLPVVALHPTVVADYREEVAKLNAALTNSDEARLEAIPKLRSLVDQITIWPSDKKKGVKIEVTGRLNSILALANGDANVEECTLTVERVKGIEPSS